MPMESSSPEEIISEKQIQTNDAQRLKLVEWLKNNCLQFNRILQNKHIIVRNQPFTYVLS